jgi:phosphate transport system substrate-binding protein
MVGWDRFVVKGEGRGRGMMGRIYLVAIVLGAMIGLLSCSSEEEPAGRTSISAEYIARGAGASFALPLYHEWVEDFNTHFSAPLYVYEGVGSANGVELFVAGDVDFGASDIPLTAAQRALLKRPALIIPMAGGLVVLAYNLGELSVNLKLSREVYLAILAGQIERWDDPAIVALNPGVAFPAESIELVVRVEGSGLTAALSRHLAQVDPQWGKAYPDINAPIDWPQSTLLAQSNLNVAETIAGTPYSLGYVDYSVASQLELSLAWLENKAGQYIEPSVDAGLVAIQSAVERFPGELAPDLADPEATAAYPLVVLSSVLLYENYPDEGQADAIRAWVAHGLDQDQQQSVATHGFLPLPESLLIMARGALQD